MNYLHGTTLGLLAAMLLAGGCSQLEVNIALNPDGSAEITERMMFSRTQLEQEVGLPGGTRLKDLLTRDRAEKRAQRMGATCKLIRHELRKAADAGVESLAVYSISDINDLRYLPPMFAAPHQPRSALRIEVGPCYARRHASPDQPGYMYVQFSMERTTSAPAPARKAQGRKVAAATPVDRQALRELIPVARDLLKDGRIRITFEAYGDLTCGTYPYVYPLRAPGASSPTNKYPLISCSGRDLDAQGKRIVDNEEVMLELLRGDWAGANIRTHADWQRGRSNARAATFYTPDMTWRNCRLTFEPSQFHSKKYFDGKLVSQGGNVKDP